MPFNVTGIIDFEEVTERGTEKEREREGEREILNYLVKCFSTDSYEFSSASQEAPGNFYK